MKIVRTIHEWQQLRETFEGKSLGFVPTMGALHEGHGALVKQSVSDNDITVVSIFVNPTQFNNPDDLENYPSTYEEDLANLGIWKTDVLLFPQAKEIYPNDDNYSIDENKDSLPLCGHDRPGHFNGVLTVVMKLLNIVQAQRAYFGEKDYQQYRLIRNMVKSFFMDVDIVAVPTQRDTEGLALSSRNLRLNPEEIETAQQVNKVLNSTTMELDEQRRKIESLGLEIDYLEERWGRIFIAAHIGSVRLIDNVALK